MRFETELVQFDACPGDPHGPTSTPIYQTATFEQEDPERFGAYDYSRSGNPTRAVLERQLARLERGCEEGWEGGARAFASGMAALSAVVRLVKPGDRIVAGSDVYGGTFRLLDRVARPYGIDVVFAPTWEEGALEACVDARTRLVLIETPTNPLQRITDVRRAAEIAHEAGAWLAVDNTMLSPALLRPLELGADLVIHSATKFLCGHADVTAGAVVARAPALAERIAFTCNAEGTALGPFDSWLLLRGLKTLGLRVERQQASARKVAAFLAEHEAVKRVYYAGLPEHPGREVLERQAAGPGSVLAFETGDRAISRAVIERCRLFKTTVSFGSINSTISLPWCMSHASIPEEVRRERALPEDLVRISVGIEDAEDLIGDLERALEEALEGAASRTAVGLRGGFSVTAETV